MGKIVPYSDQAMIATTECIAHWEKMLAWAETQPEAKIKDQSEMQEAIDEAWNGDYCSLCIAFTNDDTENECEACPLFLMGYECSATESPFVQVLRARTWGGWVINAKEMLKALKETLDEIET